MIHWLLTSDWGLFIGSLLIWAGILLLGGYFVWRYGGVRMGPDPATPSEAPTALLPIAPAEPIAPNYQYLEDSYPLAGYLMTAVDEAADATTELARVIDVTETVEIKPVDPLDVTAEIETVDPSAPLFYTLRRPRPYVAESFTQGITRAQVERARAARAEQ